VASAAKQMLALEMLCQCGVDVNYETKAGRSAMLVAVTKDLLDVSQLSLINQ
jgi:deoxyinosine 3'endonuclease (endonuclease V)